MSVRLLAGPFPMANSEGQKLTYVSVEVWYPSVGLMVTGSVTGTGMLVRYLMTMDGVCEEATRTFIFGLGQYSWWPARKRLVSLDSGVEWVHEPITLAWQKTAPEDYPTEPTRVWWYSYVKLSDRRIYLHSFDTMWRQVNGLPDAPESGPFPFSPYAVFAGRSDHDMWVPAWREGIGCFYDTVQCKPVLPVYKIDQTIPWIKVLLYVPEYGVLLSVHGLGPYSSDLAEVRVWSLEVHPTIVTVPKPIIGTPKSGQVVTYQVRVMGDDDDGAEGELVNWTLEGVGLLLDVQTKADVEGYAIARVQYQLGETGSSTVIASVLC